MLLTLLSMSFSVILDPAAFGDGPARTAVRVERGPVLDGRLDDAVHPQEAGNHPELKIGIGKIGLDFFHEVVDDEGRF